MRKWGHVAGSAVFVFVIAVFYQNCSKVDFANKPLPEVSQESSSKIDSFGSGDESRDDGRDISGDSSSDNSSDDWRSRFDDGGGPDGGDGTDSPIADTDDEDGMKNCVTGKSFAVWVDPDPMQGITVDNNVLGNIVTYQGNKKAAANYNYYSASAHPIVGPIPKGYELHVFMYEGKDGLALNFYANIDAGGSKDNEVDLNIEVVDNTSADEVLLSDDGHELKRTVSDVHYTAYEGRFHYWSNTDGGVIGPLTGEDFVIKINMAELGDLTTARFYSANGESFLLKDQYRDIRNLYIGYHHTETCQ